MKKVFQIITVFLLFSCSQKKEQMSYGVYSPINTTDTLNPDGSINLYAFGAKFDFVNDDLPAMKTALVYANSANAKSREIRIPSEKILNATGEITQGGHFVDVKYLLNNINRVDTFPCNFTEYLKGVSMPQIIIKGGTNSGIYANFNDTSKLQALIYFGGMYGDKRCQLSKEQFYLEISHLGLYAQGYFDNKGKRVGTMTTNPDFSKNNVCAVVSAFAQGLKMDEVTIYGFKEGQIHNNSYFTHEMDVTTLYCNRGFYDIRSHTMKLDNIQFWSCKKGLQTQSNKVLINGIYTNECETGLHINGSDNEIYSAYLEAYGANGNGQLIIGDSGTITADTRYLIMGTILQGLTISYPATTAYPNRIGINFMNTAGRVNITGARCQSTNIVYSNPNTRVCIDNVLGTFPAAITLKTAYIDNTGKVIY